jgi:hypothetical protein
MNDQTATPGQDTTMLLRSIKKRIVPHEESDPSNEPLFINFAHGALLGDDCYLDVGVITLESIDPEKNPDMVGDFVVLSRLVMSRRTMFAIREQITNILGAKGIEGAT